jgi:glycosyltransferase involved in cell wall biosynthesis
MSAYKILFDLSPCLDKIPSPIHLDACRLFTLLANNKHVQLSGLLYAKTGNVFVRNKHTQNRAESIEQAHYFLHEAFDHEPLFLTGILAKLRLKRFFTSTKKQYNMYPIDTLFNEVIWRNIFNANLSAHWQSTVLKNNFYYTDMTQQTWSVLNTQGYDFVIFPTVNPMRVTGDTVKIILFSDPLALTDPDFSSRDASNQFSNYLKQASVDSYFVCDTDAAREKLISFYPHLEKKSCVIPRAFSLNCQKQNDQAKLKSIIGTRLSPQLFTMKQSVALRAKLNSDESFSYMLTVSSLKPQENIVTLIHAWEKMNYQYQRNVKLIIVSSAHSIPREIENAIRPHLEKGNLILLTALPEVEMGYLYSHATLYVSAAYNENSYSLLLSAMHYACPVVLSDIPLHHWVMDDAGLYFDPYSEDAIAMMLAKVLYATDAEQLRKELQVRGEKRTTLFSQQVVSEKWLALFEEFYGVKKSLPTSLFQREE